MDKTPPRLAHLYDNSTGYSPDTPMRSHLSRAPRLLQILSAGVTKPL
jgi:hypothetical protein